MTTRAWKLKAIVVALTATSLWPIIANADALPGVAFTHPHTATELTRQQRADVGWLKGRDCRITPLTGTERHSFEAAVGHINTMLADPRLQAVLEKQGVHSKELTVALDRLRDAKRPLSVAVLSYDATEGRPCRTVHAAEGTHAVAPIGGRLLLLHRPYLVDQVHSPNQSAGQRNLARTILHEVLHSFGYRHPEGLWHSKYATSVPVWLGCAAMNYPDLGFVERQCGRAKPMRDRSPWAWDCEGEVEQLIRNQEVSAHFAGSWLPATVQSVDGKRGRVQIEWHALPGHRTWVKACRVRPEPASQKVAVDQ